MTCTITSSTTWTYTYTGNANLAVSIKVLNIGASGGFSYADATTLLTSNAVTLKEKECGYFTFLPLLQETW